MSFLKNIALVQKKLLTLSIAWVALATFIPAKNAQASEPVEFKRQQVSLFYSPFNSAYACSYATDIAETMLWRMGAQRIWVSCSGGLPWNTFVSLQMDFETAQPSTNPNAEQGEWKPFRYWDWDQACELQVRIFRAILPKFTTRDLRVSDGCWGSRGSFDFQAEVLSR